MRGERKHLLYSSINLGYSVMKYSVPVKGTRVDYVVAVAASLKGLSMNITVVFVLVSLLSPICYIIIGRGLVLFLSLPIIIIIIIADNGSTPLCMRACCLMVCFLLSFSHSCKTVADRCVRKEGWPS